MIQYEWDIHNKKWNCRAENARDLSPQSRCFSRGKYDKLMNQWMGWCFYNLILVHIGRGELYASIPPVIPPKTVTNHQCSFDPKPCLRLRCCRVIGSRVSLSRSMSWCFERFPSQFTIWEPNRSGRVFIWVSVSGAQKGRCIRFSCPATASSKSCVDGFHVLAVLDITTYINE